MRRFWAGLVAMCGAGSLSAADPAELVGQLGDPRFAVRESAAKALLKLGASAMPAVQSAIDSTADPAIRERAEAIFPRLERIAESERYLIPKLVKLDYKDVPLASIVEDLKKQTGIPLTLVSEKVALPSRAVTLTGGEVPAWQAIEKLCAAAGLKEEYRADLPLPKGTAGRGLETVGSGRVIYYNAGMGGGAQQLFTPSTAPILLADGKAEPVPGSRNSSIRVLAMPGSFEGNRVVRGAGTVVLNLDVAPLPTLNWVGSSRVRVLRAEDEDGRPLFADERASPVPPAISPYNQFAWGGGGLWIEDGLSISQVSFQPGRNPRLTPVTLRTDDRAIKYLKRLEGVVVGDIHRPNEPIIVIDDLEKLIGKAFEDPHGIKLAVNDYKTSKAGVVSIKIRVEMPQFWAMQGLVGRGRMSADDLNIGNVQNKLKFFDAAGKACATPQQRSASYSGSNWSQTYDAELYFPQSNPPKDGAGPPVKAVMIGTKISTIEVPFAMENVRLP